MPQLLDIHDILGVLDTTLKTEADVKSDLFTLLMGVQLENMSPGRNSLSLIMFFYD